MLELGLLARPDLLVQEPLVQLVLQALELVSPDPLDLRAMELPAPLDRLVLGSLVRLGRLEGLQVSKAQRVFKALPVSKV